MILKQDEIDEVAGANLATQQILISLLHLAIGAGVLSDDTVKSLFDMTMIAMDNAIDDPVTRAARRFTEAIFDVVMAPRGPGA